MYQIKRTDEEIDNCLNEAAAGEAEGSRWPGMSYEEGVGAALRWIIGDSEDNPMKDE